MQTRDFSSRFRRPDEVPESPPRVMAAGSGAGSGATEDQVNMSYTVPQRLDRLGTKVEDLAGTGDHDAKGG